MYSGILSERVKAVDGNMPEIVRVYWNRGGVSVPRRRAETHKGDYGKLLIVGGSVGYTGAPNLCARAAVRSGAGLVYLGVPEAVWGVCAVKNDEAMPFPLPCGDAGKLVTDALSPLREFFPRCGVLALGPGLGRSEGTASLTAGLVRSFPGKIVLDADALWESPLTSESATCCLSAWASCCASESWFPRTTCSIAAGFAPRPLPCVVSMTNPALTATATRADTIDTAITPRCMRLSCSRFSRTCCAVMSPASDLSPR